MASIDSHGAAGSWQKVQQWVHGLTIIERFGKQADALVYEFVAEL